MKVRTSVYFALVVCLVLLFASTSIAARLSETELSKMDLPPALEKAAESAGMTKLEYLRAVDKNCDFGIKGACQVLQQVKGFNAGGGLNHEEL
eukprot:CAMPEP_0113872312 /NCGR_PEP_ID=MMETSP0780_2-20120614/3137_1 /TAXON_ID=652834 /ORGANISM="Palpitomonas bilix" /LENGTH=92 /DNA_ID=CAMNT_0000857817 /DNA_START=56 /DNA_END=334 /DNA_ORIENTATION=+ /assembly_acc=CAM_ASM_000599